MNVVMCTRPYSHTGEVSRALLFFTLQSPAPWSELQLILVAVQSLAMWCYFNWRSDKIQRDPGREFASTLLLSVPLAVAAGIGLIMGGAGGVAGVIAYVVAIHAYALKANSPRIGSLGPLLRGLTTLAHFVMVSTLAGRVTPEAALLAAPLVLWKVTRNLVGDVRDVRTDRYEFPAVFGPAASLIVLRALFAAITVLFVWVPTPGHFECAALVALTWLATESLARRYTGASAYMWGYFGHRAFVVMTSALQLVLLAHVGIGAHWIAPLAVLTVASQWTYDRNPGKHYPAWRWRDLWASAAPA